jgi:hypothetical protein
VRTHEWPDSAAASQANFDLNREAYERLFLIRKLQQYNIHTDSDAVAQFADVVLRQFGNGQAVPLDTFIDQVLKPHGISAEDFQSFLEHYLSIQQLASVVGTSGKLITPSEIRSLYIQQYQELAVDAVFFSASNYLAKIPDPSAQELSQFYTNQQATYREPDQMQLRYVFFNVTNFMPAAEKQLGVTNLDRDADEALSRLGTNGLRYGKTPEEAKTRIREILIQDSALSNAYNIALSFQRELLAKTPVRPENLDVLAKEKGMEAKVTSPFDKEYGPGELHLNSSYPISALFNLTPDEPFAEQPIRGVDGVYVLAYDKLIPSRIPPLTEIHARVVGDYKYVQAMRLAQINGRIFGETATNEMARGKSFASVCALVKVTPTEVPPFSLSTETLPDVEDHAEVSTFKEIAFTTPVGKVSEFTPTRDGGFAVYVRERLPMDEGKMNTQLPQFSKLVRQRREGEAFEMWFSHEASAALQGIPAFESQSRKPAGM